MQIDKISNYLISYYKINDKTPYVIKEVAAEQLLCPKRFDLGAKLYYIHSYVTGKNSVLAEKLYDSHISAFQDGIIEECGNRSKRGFETYHATFIELIEKFIHNSFDQTKKYVPVDQNMCLLDGAHRTACSIYFKKKVTIIMFPSICAYTYDKKFFHRHGLEQGYLDLMEYSLFTHGLVISPDFTAHQQIREELKIDTMEKEKAIHISAAERRRCRCIRFFRHHYTRIIISIKKLLHKPI